MEEWKWYIRAPAKRPRNGPRQCRICQSCGHKVKIQKGLFWVSSSLFLLLGGRTGVDRELGKLGLAKARGSLRGDRSKEERPGCSVYRGKCKVG